MAVTDDRSAALLVRVWFEDGSEQFRARVTAVGLSTPEEDHTVVLASSPREVIDAVGDWLDQLVRRASRTD
ncbi:hypothetical protein [Blastococcus sp. DSM 46786]|uniref:hypothetical protein n=1 Tax=Blastococcus sp. DSM 46786 TaxID=1798227 RepID=UPI001480FCCB|nr:hypothetical protein [Blastococcus sp. DSM 46786]